MESSAISIYNPQKSKVFPGSSSSSYMEPEVIEITPPYAGQTSKSKAKALKQKEVVYHEIIDVDMDEDRNDVVFIEGKVESNKKRKGAMGISLGSSSAEQGSKDRGQTTKKVDSNNKGKGGVQMNSVGPGHSSKSFVAELESFYDLDDYILEDDYLALQSRFDHMDIPTGIEAQIPWFPETLQMKKNSTVHAASTYSGPHANNSSKNLPLPFVETPQKFKHQNMPFNYTHNQVAPPMKAPHTVSYFSNSSNTPQVGGGGGISSSFFQLPMNTGYPLGVDTSFSMYPMGDMNHMIMDKVLAGNSPRSSSVIGSSSSMAKVVDNEDVLKRYESFKKFDTVVDFSDHYYAAQNSGMKQPPKNWAKKIQDEWRILEKDLPDTIFVRAYESRMDLLRAVIIGADGTPYHDGLFFFDICFQSSYPSCPPLVHYHSGGLRINPNLYNCGKVCLSLLNTWSGAQKERWIPGTSTMLQVLVSIQGLILNTKPYFNEPGYAHSSGSIQGEKRSMQYNESTLILSLKTMVYTMKKPPKNFEDLVSGHFRNRVRDILMACKAYTEGVQVGCLVRGGVQDVDEDNDSCSPQFKADVVACVKTLVAAFKNIGAKEAEEFIGLTVKKTKTQTQTQTHSSSRVRHAFAPAYAHNVHAYLPPPPPPPPPSAFSAAIPSYNHYW
uniref:E2 ubiquitin-conjugating enzyme n=1 Tax=Lactuca sativa TaxID=4236 RepID=A0A9R1VKN7_LACSA|nr:hypothetical protein LSAT_V11C500275230 [Lactuca sativa]